MPLLTAFAIRRGEFEEVEAGVGEEREGDDEGRSEEEAGITSIKVIGLGLRLKVRLGQARSGPAIPGQT